MYQRQRDPTKGIQRAKAEDRGVRREKKGQECPGWVSATPGEPPVFLSHAASSSLHPEEQETAQP